MNDSKEDVGVLLNYELDLAFGTDENNFECTVGTDLHCCQAGYFLRMEGTECGGVIDGIASNTADKEVTYSGRTWHGILGSKIILPLQEGDVSDEVTIKTVDSNDNSLVDKYLVISGDAHACMRFVLGRIGLDDLFEVPDTELGIAIDQYQFNRFTDAYSGIMKMLKSAGLKMKLSFENDKVKMSAEARYNYATDEEFDSDLVEFKAKKNYKTVNHLICLGTGELENRQVIHLYADVDGNISQTQTQFDFDEYTATFDYPSVESLEELERSGRERLSELWQQNELSVDFDATSDSYDVGDIIGAVDNITGIVVTTEVTKKIVTIKNGRTTISYKVGE